MNKDIHNLYSAYRTINEGVYDSNNSAMGIVNKMRGDQNKSTDTSKLAYASSSRNMKPEFADMMRDPSKRPQAGANKAADLDRKFQQAVESIKQRYASVTPQFSSEVEELYNQTRSRSEDMVNHLLSSLKAGDQRQFDKMTSGDTSGGTYNSVDTVGHADISFENKAIEGIKRILRLDDAYYSGNESKLRTLLGI